MAHRSFASATNRRLVLPTRATGIAGSQTISPVSNRAYVIVAGAAATITIGASKCDGVVVIFLNTTAFEHILSFPLTNVKGDDSDHATLTMPAFPGSSVMLGNVAGNWHVLASNGSITIGG